MAVPPIARVYGTAAFAASGTTVIPDVCACAAVVHTTSEMARMIRSMTPQVTSVCQQKKKGKSFRPSPPTFKSERLLLVLRETLHRRNASGRRHLLQSFHYIFPSSHPAIPPTADPLRPKMTALWGIPQFAVQTSVARMNPCVWYSGCGDDAVPIAYPIPPTMTAP